MDNLSEYYGEIFSATKTVFEKSVSNIGCLAKVHQFVEDLSVWFTIITPRPEAEVLNSAIREYQFGAISLVCGLYRQSFSSLRLSLELSLASIYFSTNRLELAEWFSGRSDISWATLIDSENGILSKRYAKAFYPELEESVTIYNMLAKTIYRELSEFVHGNAHTWQLTSDSIAFNEHLYNDWLRKLDIIQKIVQFSLTLRFIKEISNTNLIQLENQVIETLGHLEQIRTIFSLSRENIHE